MRLGLLGFGNIAVALLEQLSTAVELPLEHLSVLCLPEMVEDARDRLSRDFPAVSKTVLVGTDTRTLLSAKLDLVVECAGHGAVATHVPLLLRAGVDVILASVGALSDPELDAVLRAAARQGGSRLILTTGAIGGVDLLSAIAAAGGLEVTYRGSKPPVAWQGTDAERVVDLKSVSQPTRFFAGTAREAAMAYPRNANVAATLALAGAGFDATRVELIADPQASGNVHEYAVTSPIARFSIRIENLPSKANAKTSVSTVYSILREIRNRVSPVAI